ncbi:MAG TPA: hypothetical protein VFM46_08525, partial [Pseudomonadales bacterium]|nr:hypothetical protein [Pseudomonadales bacterium]
MSQKYSHILKRAPWLLCSTLMIAACGGGGGGGYQDVTNQQVAPSSVSGRAVKGVLSHAVVKAFPVSNGSVGSTALAQTETDSSGNYAMTLPAGYQGQVVIQISASSNASQPTLMTCDVPAGCGNYDSYPSRGPAAQDLNAPWGEINYGDRIALNPNDGFELLSVSDTLRPGATISANVSALSHLTAVYLMNSSISADALTQARSQLADLFGLPANYYSYTPVDVTSTREAAAANATQLQSSLLSSSILSLALSGGSGLAPGAAIAQNMGQLSSHYVSLGGQLIARNGGAASTVPTLQDINSTAAGMAQQLAATNNVMPSVISSFSAVQARISQMAAGTVTQASATNVAPSETPAQFFANQVWPLLSQDCT